VTREEHADEFPNQIAADGRGGQRSAPNQYRGPACGHYRPLQALILGRPNEPVKEGLRALKHNAWLAMLVGQDTHAPSVPVPFFGRQGRTPVAAATLAMRRDLPALAAFIQRRPAGGHRIIIRPPVTHALISIRIFNIPRRRRGA
jgi:lipid A biosynthesis acyltransferase